jgi:hypothetical protein
MINWHILSASANNGWMLRMRVCVRHRMKKGIYIVIMKIIRINGAPRVVACRLAWVCACTAVPLNGMVCTDTPGSRSRMTCACACARLCGIVGKYLCCHGPRCGSSSRRPGHSRPDSPPFQRLSLPSPAQNKLEGIVTFENCPHGLRNWKREGLGACARLRCAPTQRRLHLPAQMRRAGGSDLRKWPHDECLPNLQGEFQCGNIRWNPQSAVN